MNGANQLRELLATTPLVTAMAAHNPLSALLVEEAGFDAIWASGFELSAALGVPDASIVSASEHLDMTRRMVERTRIPVIADIDTGYGNAVNVQYTVRAYANAGAAAVVIEDKNFPKDSSLRNGGRHILVPISEFEGKIQSALHARDKTNLVVIARTEALIAGAGFEAALERAQAYSAAGADLVLVHSKSDTSDELMEFIRRWHGDTPIVIVPTSYPEFGEQDAIATDRIKILIYGNHTIRAAVAGMRTTLAAIRSDRRADKVEDDIASVEEIIALQGDANMRKIEKRFLR